MIASTEISKKGTPMETADMWLPEDGGIGRNYLKGWGVLRCWRKFQIIEVVAAQQCDSTYFAQWLNICYVSFTSIFLQSPVDLSTKDHLDLGTFSLIVLGNLGYPTSGNNHFYFQEVCSSCPFLLKRLKCHCTAIDTSEDSLVHFASKNAEQTIHISNTDILWKQNL